MKNFIGFLLLTAIAALFLTSCSKEQTSASNKDKAFDRVMKTGILRCSYVAYSPANIVDPNNQKMTGILHDAAEEMGAILDLKIEWVEESTWASFVETVSSGRADAFCGAAFGMAAELKNAETVGPFYYSGITLWTRENDHRFDAGLSSVDDPAVTVAGEDGSIASHLHQSLFPKARLLSLPANAPYSLKLDNVAQSKADITLVETYVGRDYVANNPGTLRNITVGKPVTVYPNVFLVNKGEFKLQSMLQGAANMLHNNGTMERIVKKYEKYPDAILRVSKPYLTR